MRHVLPMLIVITAAAGCQCIGLTEKYQDKIDRIANHEPHLDRFYKPTWDVSRIGRPDWCQSPINRWWCGKNCGAHRNAPLAAYPNAIYPGMQVGRPGGNAPSAVVPPGPTDSQIPQTPPSAESDLNPFPSLPPMPQPAPLPESGENKAPSVQDPLEPAPFPENPSPAKPLPENLPVPPVPTAPTSLFAPAQIPKVQWVTHEELSPSAGLGHRDHTPLWSAARKRPDTVPPASHPAEGSVEKTESSPSTNGTPTETRQWKPRPGSSPTPPAAPLTAPRQIAPAPDWAKPIAPAN